MTIYQEMYVICKSIKKAKAEVGVAYIKVTQEMYNGLLAMVRTRAIALFYPSSNHL